MPKRIIYACRACKLTESSEVIDVREMMYGTRDKFEYVRCLNCGCLQIVEIPPELGRYYPHDYYSLAKQHESLVVSFLKLRRAAAYRGESTLLGRALASLTGPLTMPKWCSLVRTGVSGTILDVGCGAGHLLLTLRNVGFKHLMGVDPYISEDLFYSGGVHVKRGHLHEIEGSFDLVMAHHSLEHVANQIETLSSMRNLLARSGQLLVRIPIAGSAFEKYGASWVGLDPPRHLVVHTEASFRLLAERAALTIVDSYFDSNAEQFWVSELYKSGIPLRGRTKEQEQFATKALKDMDMHMFEALAVELNSKRDGDQACFILEPTTNKRDT